MIEGIDIFAPRESGLPDFSRLTPAQIFNGSAAASLQSMKENDPLGLLKDGSSTEGVEESPWKTTTLNPVTGRREEVRKARVVAEILNDQPARQRGHTRINGNRSSYAPGDSQEPPLPESPETPASDILVPGKPPGWHPPMAPDYIPLSSPASDNILLPPLELTPEEQKSAALRKLPVMLLEELKNLHLV